MPQSQRGFAGGVGLRVLVFAVVQLIRAEHQGQIQLAQLGLVEQKLDLRSLFAQALPNWRTQYSSYQ